jgi:hypothetical protein
MLKIIPSVAFLFLVVTANWADAANCEGQRGRLIFEDDFTDDSGGWAHEPSASWNATFGKSGLRMHIQDPTLVWALLNIAFTARDGDFCAEAVMPKVAASGIVSRTGLIFLANDTENFYVLMIGGDLPTPSNQLRGAIGLWRKHKGTWGRLGDWSDPKFKLEPGSVVALRAMVKPDLIIASVNGVEVKKQRAQLPGESLRFGLYVETNKAVPAPGMAFQFKRYKVTAGD